MRFVRVPPYENWAFWTNFYFSWENGEFFGVKHVAPSSTLKMRKSHKKSARVYAYTHAYTQLREGGGRSAPPGLIGLNKHQHTDNITNTTTLSINMTKYQIVTVTHFTL